MYDKKVKKYARKQEKLLKKLEYRVVSEKSQGRNSLMRDYARVLYSSSFRRLQGKMQLLGVDSNKLIEIA